jgi:transketolase
MAQEISTQQIKKIILEQSKRAHVGHIGSALSVADIVATLYSQVLNISSPEHVERDRFILSKGHAVLAVYAALFAKGWITQAELDTYCGEGSLLGVHPEFELQGIDFSTGSLGQGLSIGTGAALAARLHQSQRRVFVLLSDAECNEGSTWEAAMFAAHHKLTNLIAIVDCNGQQALGYTQDVLNLAPTVERWQAFGWQAHAVDGHDINTLASTMKSCRSESGRPHILVANTIFGHGVSFMESRIKWHYWPMSESEYQQALRDIGVVS